jgi:hypothetical protein
MRLDRVCPLSRCGCQECGGVVLSPRQLLRLWELHHGTLDPKQKEAFLQHPEIPAIIIYSPTSVAQLLRENPKLEKLRMALEIHGVIRKKKGAQPGSTATSILKKPRPHSGANLPLSDKSLPKPKREAKKSLPKERSKDSQLRKIAQRYRWWE